VLQYVLEKVRASNDGQLPDLSGSSFDTIAQVWISTNAHVFVEHLCVLGEHIR
jgi:hypothetical protein